MLTIQKLATTTALCCALLPLAGCATLPPGERDARDRFERFNRSMFAFNRVVDRAVARPVARAYVKVTPRPVRAGVSNLLANLEYPTTIVNDLLQGKLASMGRDVGRLVVNTTLGIGGLFDPATRMGLTANNEDLGQTFGRWGAKPGPFLMLPLLGPSSIRDSVGRVGDTFTNARTYLEPDGLRYGLLGLDLLDTRAALLDTEAVMERSYDPYTFVRNAYLQRREYLVKDGELETQYDEVEPADPAAPAEPPAAGAPQAPQAQPQQQR